MSNWYTEKFRATDLTNKLKEGVIKVPHYQRGQIWKVNQKEKLIDSIKSGFPFGTILLYKKEDNTYQLIDGLQRSSTLYEYLHTPAKFFRGADISRDSINEIFNLLLIKGGNKDEIKSRIVVHIKEWVIEYHKTMEDVKNIDAIECVRFLQAKFPTCNAESALDIASILMKEFSTFRNECEELANAEIPAIIYTGNPDNLPEVFNRINSKGTALSKYQILSATWATHEYTINPLELEEIINFVDKFYISIIDGNFSVDGYNANDIRQSKRLNLYQILFGFGKILSKKFPRFFCKAKNDKDIESCGFNLVNCCFGNKNSKISNLPSLLNSVFDNDDEKICSFLVNIINTAEKVYKLFKPYLEFKLNKRDENVEIYHSEFQICSIISNYFHARYSTFTYDELSNNIIGVNILTEGFNRGFDQYKKDFKRNVFKKYLIDIINDNWRGSGDIKMDDISRSKNYYTEDITKQIMINELDHWINQINLNRHEYTKVANPKASEKLMLSVIYSHFFSAFEQNDDINYDIEHLATKGLLKILLKNIPSREEGVGLPISSFANICLLREEINRKKKDKTLYNDFQYLINLKEKSITLTDIETKYSFTDESDLDWINKTYTNYSSLKKEYFHFLNVRFERQRNIIINNLYPEEIYNTQKNTTEQNVYCLPIESKKRICSPPLLIPNLIDETTLTNITTKLVGWERDVFVIIESFENPVFNLKDVYLYTDYFKTLHPYNNNIDAKIRQVLQRLRDMGLVEFINDKGMYKRR